MPVKTLTILFSLVLIASCSQQKNVTEREYKFSPIGWSFKLPPNWVAQEDYDINRILEKYSDKAGVAQATIDNFHDQKIFMLKTESSFNRFTSEIVTFPHNIDDLERVTRDYKQQLSNQLQQIFQTAPIKSGSVLDISIDGVEFKMFEVQLQTGDVNKAGMFMEVYMGRFRDRILTISYTCLTGNSDCHVAKQAIENSRFE